MLRDLRHQRIEFFHIHVIMVLLEQEYSHCVIDVLFDSLFGSGRYIALPDHSSAWLWLRAVRLSGLCRTWTGRWRSSVGSVRFCLSPDALVNIIVGCTGGRVAFAGSQFDVDCSVFEEEVHQHTFFPGGLARDIAVHSTVLRSFEGEGSVGDDCRIEFYELAAFCGLQINGIAIGSAFYCSGYGVTFVSAVTSCEYGSGSEQVS